MDEFFFTENDEDYAEAREAPAMTGAALDATVGMLGPAEPICLTATESVHDAVQRMLSRRQAGVLVVDADGRLVGIFTERDVLMRVVGRDLDPRRTLLADVMTRDPEALSMQDRIAYAVHCMSVAGHRTVPIVDAERRPLGVVTVSDVIRWLAGMFPEAVLNLPPGDTIKHPDSIDMG